MWEPVVAVKKNLGNTIYSALFELGKISGCHQRADRSFKLKGKQFPVCARCTGAVIGYYLGLFVYAVFDIPMWLAIVFCALMFLDWYIQYIGIMESNNYRRCITGFLCGFSLMQMFIKIFLWIICFFNI